jgi:hypothetical protein
MIEEMKKEDFINDAKVLLAYLSSLLLSEEFNGMVGAIGSIVAIIYGIYRIYKLHLDAQTSKEERLKSKADREIAQINLEKEKKNLHKY